MEKKSYFSPVTKLIAVDTDNILTTGSLEEGKGDGGGPTAKKKDFDDIFDFEED